MDPVDLQDQFLLADLTGRLLQPHRLVLHLLAALMVQQTLLDRADQRVLEVLMVQMDRLIRVVQVVLTLR